MKKTKKISQLKLIIILCVICISTFIFGVDAEAASSGEIPCSEGSVT